MPTVCVCVRACSQAGGHAGRPVEVGAKPSEARSSRCMSFACTAGIALPEGPSPGFGARSLVKAPRESKPRGHAQMGWRWRTSQRDAVGSCDSPER